MKNAMCKDAKILKRDVSLCDVTDDDLVAMVSRKYEASVNDAENVELYDEWWDARGELLGRLVSAAAAADKRALRPFAVEAKVVGCCLPGDGGVEGGGFAEGDGHIEVEGELVVVNTRKGNHGDAMAVKVDGMWFVPGSMADDVQLSKRWLAPIRDLRGV